MTGKSVFPPPKLAKKNLKQVAIPRDIYAHLAYLAFSNHRTLAGQFTHIFEEWRALNGIPRFEELEEFKG